MSTITCNEEKKGNAKCKNALSHPLGELGVTYTVYGSMESALSTSY